MHGNLLVIDWKSDEAVQSLVPEHVDGAMLGGGAEAFGCLALREGARGVRASEVLRDEPDAPDILLEMMQMMEPRVSGGVDAARKGDVENVGDLADLVAPAYLIVGGRWVEPHGGETMGDWLARVHRAVEEAADETWLAVYDVHE